MLSTTLSGIAGYLEMSVEIRMHWINRAISRIECSRCNVQSEIPVVCASNHHESSSVILVKTWMNSAGGSHNFSRSNRNRSPGESRLANNLSPDYQASYDGRSTKLTQQLSLLMMAWPQQRPEHGCPDAGVAKARGLIAPSRRGKCMFWMSYSTKTDILTSRK